MIQENWINNKIWIVFITLMSLISFFVFSGKSNRPFNINHSLKESMSVATNLNYEKGIEIIQESPRMTDDNDNFWVNSGAMFYSQRDLGYSILGDLPRYSYWRFAYLASNPVDTDEGYHPQNILRLITKEKTYNFLEQAYFLVAKYNESDSPNRNNTNGIFLIGRYKDGANLYYAGVRVDGTAIIKKKINGVYQTLDQKVVFSGLPYDKKTNPILLPQNKWFGLRMKMSSNSLNSVKIELYVDREYSGEWEKLIEYNDVGSMYKPLLTEGYNGIRSDFMDIIITNYKVISQ